MKSLRFVLLAFVAGVHGFALLAPYLLVMFAATQILGRKQG